MPALLPTEFAAKIIWLGRVVSGNEGIRSTSVEGFDVSLEGAEGEMHGGVTRASCVRVREQHPEGTEIRNVRQFSIVAAEEIAEIASEIGVAELDPEWLGASIVIEGIPDFSHIPPSARLQNAAGTTLVIDMQNRPCNLPAREIQKERPGHGKAFKSAAVGRRGVTAWVEREGALHVGDVLRLHIPDQRSWTHLNEARSQTA